MKKRKVYVSFLAVFLALLFIVPMLIIIFNSGDARAAVTESDIYNLRQQQERLQQQQEELQRRIDANKGMKSSVLAQKEALDTQVALTRQEIDNLNSQIDTYEELIALKELEYQDALQEEAHQLEVFKARVRMMEENGKVSYLAVLFSATSFSDLLGRLDFISEIMESDEEVINSLEKIQAEIQGKKTELEGIKLELESARTQQETKMANLSSQIEEANSLISNLDYGISEYMQAYNDNAAAEEELAERILQMTKELEAQLQAEEEQRSLVNATGSYIWPTFSGKYVTSAYGYRHDPISGVYKKHNGVDIGASYRSDVLAADGGTVITAEYGWSYGNYVMIYHGGNRYTLYAHMDELLVSEGETLRQGDTIGLAGSTGWSTGTHIHFEIIEDGDYVDPLDFFTDYIPYWD